MYRVYIFLTVAKKRVLHLKQILIMKGTGDFSNFFLYILFVWRDRMMEILRGKVLELK